MKNIFKNFCALFPVLLLCSCVNTINDNEDAKDDKEYNVLFIGNSFTYYNSLDSLVHDIAENIGVKMTTKRYAVGAHSLLEDTNADDSLGSLIQQDLKNNQYTDIVLQDKSNFPYNHYNDFKNGVSGMKNIIEENQENARITIYETWGYNSENLTAPIPEMESTIRANTKMVSRLYSLNISYVGEAFTYIYENYSSINLYASDNKHPSYVGSYLAGLVFVATLANVHVTNVNFLGKGITNSERHVETIDAATLDILKNVAEIVVYGNH